MSLCLDEQETVGERAGEMRGRPASLALQYLYTRHNGQGIPGHSRPRGLGDVRTYPFDHIPFYIK